MNKRINSYFIKVLMIIVFFMMLFARIEKMNAHLDSVNTSDSEEVTTEKRFEYTFAEVDESVVIVSDVYVRDEPYNDSNILTIAYHGTTWHRVGYNEFWSQLEMDGRIVYAATRFMTPIMNQDTLMTNTTESFEDDTEKESISTTEEDVVENIDTSESIADKESGNQSEEETVIEPTTKSEAVETTDAIVNESTNDSITEESQDKNNETSIEATNANKENITGLKATNLVGVVLVIVLLLILSVSLKLYTMTPKKNKKH